MIIKIVNYKPVLEDIYNFNSLKTVLSTKIDASELVRIIPGSHIAGENAIWVAIDALQAMGPASEEWNSGFLAMIAAARPYGWVSDDGKSVRTHVEWELES